MYTCVLLCREISLGEFTVKRVSRTHKEDNLDIEREIDFMCVYVCAYVCVCVCAYVEREKEKERERYMVTRKVSDLLMKNYLSYRKIFIFNIISFFSVNMIMKLIGKFFNHKFS